MFPTYDPMLTVAHCAMVSCQVIMMFYMVIMAILVGSNFSRSGCGSESK